MLFGAFFVLVVVSAGVTFWGINLQKDDALLINLAGRQRMLVQQISRLALKSASEKDPADLAALQEARGIFEQTLQALQEGGEVFYLPDQEATLSATRDSRILSQLEILDETWRELLPSLDEVNARDAGEPGYLAAVGALQERTPELVAQADRIVRLYEAAASQKMALLRRVQFGFFAAALGLLGLAAYWTHRAILEPLRELDRAAERLGQGDLDTPIQAQGLEEVQVLADTFETTRIQLLHSQQELIAWGNTLEEHVTQRTRELEGLYQVSKDISSRLDIQHVLRTVTEQARQLLDAEVAMLCLAEEPKQVLTLHSTSGFPEAVIHTSTSLNETLPSLVLGGERAFLCGQDGCQGTCGMIAAPYRTSHLAAPLRMGERVIGALCVGSTGRAAFSKDAEVLLTRLANSAAIAIENARLYDQAERLATLEERQRLAAEMHDGMAQTVNYLRLTADQADDQIQNGEGEQAVETLSRLGRALNQLEGEMRRAIASLQEDLPPYYPLQEQLAYLADEVGEVSGLVSWETSLKIPLILPGEESEQVLRVAREALLNACRHSQASTIRLRLERDNGQARVVIEDDGLGFDPLHPLVEDGRQHFGLKIMRARAARIAGQVEVRSSPGKGARVILTWPVTDEPRSG